MGRGGHAGLVYWEGRGRGCVCRDSCLFKQCHVPSQLFCLCFQGDVVPSLERLFRVGTLMPCYVTAVGGKRVSLSVNPRLVNTHLTEKDIKPNMVGSGVEAKL